MKIPQIAFIKNTKMKPSSELIQNDQSKKFLVVEDSQIRSSHNSNNIAFTALIQTVSLWNLKENQ